MKHLPAIAAVILLAFLCLVKPQPEPTVVHLVMDTTVVDTKTVPDVPVVDPPAPEPLPEPAKPKAREQVFEPHKFVPSIDDALTCDTCGSLAGGPVHTLQPEEVKAVTECKPAPSKVYYYPTRTYPVIPVQSRPRIFRRR